MVQLLPPTPDQATGAQLRWPWAKFGLPAEDLFTSLHERFNTRPVGIQEPWAFHRDVIDCANSSATKEEFYEKLTALKARRIEEIDSQWSIFTDTPAATPKPLTDEDMPAFYALVMRAINSNARPHNFVPRPESMPQRGQAGSAANGGQPNLADLVFRTPSNRGPPIPVYAADRDPDGPGQSTKRKEDGVSDDEESDNPWYSVEQMQHLPPSGGPGASPPAL